MLAVPALDGGTTVGAALLKEEVMDTKNKPGQKSEGRTKQPTRPGSEQVRSGTSLEREQSEKHPKAGEMKEGQIKGGKK